MSRNKQLFQEVFDQHFEDVYSYVAYRLSPDREAARDVTQDVFLAAIECWPSYRGEGTVLSWLRGIARLKVADVLRLRYEQKSPQETLPLTEIAAPAASPDIEQAETLAGALALLPCDEVELLEEKYLEGLSVREIAAKHARSEKAIESALSRAREHLRDKFHRLASE